MRIEVLTDHPEERFTPGARLALEGRPASLVIDAARPVDDGPGWWITFEGRPDRGSVEDLRGRYLEADVELDALRASGAVLWDEVIGSRVVDLEGRELGVVADVYRTGGAEVYVVRGPGGEFDVPAVRDVIRVFAPDQGELVVDPVALGIGDEEAPAEPPPRRRPRWSRHGRGGPPPAMPDEAPG